MWPLVIGIVLGNYLYQYFGPQDWAAAFDHSYFQLFAVGAVLLVQYWDRRKQRGSK